MCDKTRNNDECENKVVSCNCGCMGFKPSLDEDESLQDYEITPK